MTEYDHLSDENLLLLADGELNAHRASQANTHLASCWECRARLRRMEATIADFVDVHHRTLDPQLPPAAGPRALLKARLAGPRSPQPGGSWLQGLRQSFSAGNLGLRYAAAMLLVLITAAVAAHRLLPPDRQMSQRAYRSVASEPDRRLTPGASRMVSVSDVCRANYSDDTHLLSAAVRQKVLQEYGMAGRQSQDYELDYLISPQLGGTDDIRNLWPEPETAAGWNMRAKDDLEDRLHQMVCQGRIDLSTAQSDLSTDWISAYKRYFGTDRPIQPL